MTDLPSRQPDLDVVIVPTGTANLASVIAGLRRAGGSPRLARGPHDLEGAARVMLPGVGSFGAAMARLESAGFVAPLKARLAAGLPTMAICVGMQLLCESSEESEDARGLGLIAARLKRFTGEVRVPQIGWNRVRPAAEQRLIHAEGHAYFANSYRLTEPPEGWSGAIADHGGPFIAALERGALLACQFHPELSGAWGAEVLRRWVQSAPEDGGAAC